MKKQYEGMIWKNHLIIGFVLACIDFSSVMLYGRNYFPNLGLIMIGIIFAATIIRYYCDP